MPGIVCVGGGKMLVVGVVVGVVVDVVVGVVVDVVVGAVVGLVVVVVVLGVIDEVVGVVGVVGVIVFVFNTHIGPGSIDSRSGITYCCVATTTVSPNGK